MESIVRTVKRPRETVPTNLVTVIGHAMAENNAAALRMSATRCKGCRWLCSVDCGFRPTNRDESRLSWAGVDGYREMDKPRLQVVSDAAENCW